MVCLTSNCTIDRVTRRGIFVVFLFCAGAADYVILAAVHNTGVRYFATFLVCAGLLPALTHTFTCITDNQGSASKRGAGLAIFGLLGQCGPILVARVLPETDQSWYSRGM